MRIAPRFGCTLVIRAKDDDIERFESETVYPSKKLAKEAVAKLAVRSVLALKPSLPSPSKTNNLPESQHFRPDSADPAWQVPQPSTSYQTIRNARVQILPEDSKAVAKAATGPPPPYTAHPLSGTVRRLHHNAPANNRQDHHPSISSGPSYEPDQLSASTENSDQPNLKVLRQHLLEAFGPNCLHRMSFHLHKQKSTGLYSGFLRLELAHGNLQIFESGTESASVAAAKEELAAKALSGTLWRELSTLRQPEVEKGTSDAVSKTVDRARTYHPVSFVHQMCQTLLGTEPEHKAVFEVFKPTESCEFTSGNE